MKPKEDALDLDNVYADEPPQADAEPAPTHTGAPSNISNTAARTRAGERSEHYQKQGSHLKEILRNALGKNQDIVMVEETGGTIQIEWKRKTLPSETGFVQAVLDVLSIIQRVLKLFPQDKIQNFLKSVQELSDRLNELIYQASLKPEMARTRSWMYTILRKIHEGTNDLAEKPLKPEQISKDLFTLIAEISKAEITLPAVVSEQDWD